MQPGKPVGDELGEFQSPGGRIWGFPKRQGSQRRKCHMRGKVLPARKARVSGITCGRWKGALRGRDCRRCGNSLIGIWI